MSMNYPVVGYACHSCAVYLNNCDDSHMDADDIVTVDATMGAIQADHGYVWVDADTDDRGGYWDCSLCGWTQIGDDAYPIYAEK